jgi:hypothetical protein
MDRSGERRETSNVSPQLTGVSRWRISAPLARLFYIAGASVPGLALFAHFHLGWPEQWPSVMLSGTVLSIVAVMCSPGRPRRRAVALALIPFAMVALAVVALYLAMLMGPQDEAILDWRRVGS